MQLGGSKSLRAREAKSCATDRMGVFVGDASFPDQEGEVGVMATGTLFPRRLATHEGLAEARVTETRPWLQPPLWVDRLSVLDPDPACCLLYAGSDGHGQRLCALGPPKVPTRGGLVV